MTSIEKINVILTKKGMHGAELTRAIGIKSNAVYSQWNTKRSKPSIKNLHKIADYLEVNIDDIMPDPDKPSPPPAGDGIPADLQFVIDAYTAANKEEKALIIAQFEVILKRKAPVQDEG